METQYSQKQLEQLFSYNVDSNAQMKKQVISKLIQSQLEQNILYDEPNAIQQKKETSELSQKQLGHTISYETSEKIF